MKLTEQENLIHELDKANKDGNKIHTYTLVLFPLISTLPYLRTLFNSHATLFSIISITSLLSTAYLLVTLPPGQTGIEFIDRLTKSSDPIKTSGQENFQKLVDGKGPLKKLLPYLNLGLCASQTLLGNLVISKKLGDLWVGFCWLPIINYGAVLLAAWIMGSVNPHGDLSGLRYGYKGA